ncbi:MAG: group I intron-associated PD-(D/E)XK endonuclease [Candidatus Sulfotelmatobacter sp.]
MKKPKTIRDKRKPKIIKDKKKRGEWAESVFLARASEEGLAASKPWGDSRSFDCVVGRPGKFVAVQVKCTIAKLESGDGYICSTCSSHKPYRKGSFDYLAAYVIPEDVWYIIPAHLIFGLKSISLCTVTGEAKYEEYREAWSLLRKASEIAEPESGAEQVSLAEPVPRFPRNGLERMQAAANYFKRYTERSDVMPRKPEDKG